jgi:hypothetical protein
MDLESLFSIAGYIAMTGWIILVVLPKQFTAQLIAGVILPLLLSIGYLTLIAMHLKGAEGGFGSLHDVATLFSKQELLLAGWIHYLAFDLFIGAWALRDSQQHGIPHLVMIPCMLMTFMLGPIGLLFYFAIRTAKLRRITIQTS